MLPSNVDVGQAVKFTLAEAYAFARKGELFVSIEPIEFATLNRAQRREHMRALKSIAKQALRGKAVKP